MMYWTNGGNCLDTWQGHLKSNALYNGPETTLPNPAARVEKCIVKPKIYPSIVRQASCLALEDCCLVSAT